MADLIIPSLQGGLNETDLPAGLQDDECAEAMNVELYLANLGERRLGCAPVDITDSGLDAETSPVLLAERNPDNDITNPEHWVVAATPGTSSTIAYEVQGVWTEVTPTDAIVTTAPDIYHCQAQALNGKLFFAYPSAQDRLHVWDGTHLRRTGLKQPTAAPTAADT